MVTGPESTQDISVSVLFCHCCHHNITITWPHFGATAMDYPSIRTAEEATHWTPKFKRTLYPESTRSNLDYLSWFYSASQRKFVDNTLAQTTTSFKFVTYSPWSTHLSQCYTIPAVSVPFILLTTIIPPPPNVVVMYVIRIFIWKRNLLLQINK